MARRALIAVLVALMVLMALVVFTALMPRPAAAEEAPGHSLFHEYYRYWYNQKGTHCCDERHCRPLSPEETRWVPGDGWQVLISGAWHTVGATRFVQDDRGLGPFASACYEEHPTQGLYFWCFDPPDPAI